MIKVAINGYGRIGQSVLRALYETSVGQNFKVVAINSLADIETLTYMTRFDTTHGRFPVPVDHDGKNLLIKDDTIRISSSETPEELDWQELGVDLLFECSGAFGDRETAGRYLDAGVKKVLFSHPGEPDMDATIVYGVNEGNLSSDQTIVSAASCTTNCVTPILHILEKNWGIENGLMTTIHSAMNDQPMVDSPNAKNLRLSRSGQQSIIPVETSLSKGIERLLPHMAGKFDCLHVRVPTLNVSALDLSINLKTDTSVAEVNEVIYQESRGAFSHILGYSEEPHASIDFNHDAHSCIVDGTQTKVNSARSVKLLCWFDNEWGFANRMLDVALHWSKL